MRGAADPGGITTAEEEGQIPVPVGTTGIVRVAVADVYVIISVPDVPVKVPNKVVSVLAIETTATV